MIEVTFLGTGSAVPTSARNHPAVLLKYKAENMLFDCGEGTQRQFRKARLNPCKLTRLFISHWHGDHVLGIPGLLQTLVLNNYPRVLEVYGPRGTKKFMNLMLKLFVHRDKIKVKIHEVSQGKILEEEDFFVVAEKMEHGTPTLAYSFVEKDRLRINKEKLAKLKLGNLPKLQMLAKGRDVVIKGKKIKAKSVTYLQKGKKIAIVVDTQKNSGIVKLAKGADLFICEATYLNEEDLARDYKHLTVGQAAEMAKRAGVGKLVLTHISQRYEKDLNNFLAVAQKKFKNSVVASDLMKLEV